MSLSDLDERLVNRLSESAKRTQLPFEKRLLETGAWYFANKERIPRENVHARLDFLEKANEILLELSAMALERLQQAEDRRRSPLVFPNGLQ